jgi:hypothetical protein
MLNLLFALVAGEATTTPPTKPAIQLKCDVGPVLRNFGNRDWKIYSCTGLSGLMFTPVFRIPGTPFFYQLLSSGDDYSLVSFGPGQASDFSAQSYIKGLTKEHIEAIIEETKQVKPEAAADSAKEKQ